jgi:hypothetical protein
MQAIRLLYSTHYFVLTFQYSKSSDTNSMHVRVSPWRIRAGSICAAITLRMTAFREVGPQPVNYQNEN